MQTAPTLTAPMIRRYDRLAPRYDRLHRTWLRLAGGEAQSALEAAARTAIFPGARLLDAGCGTGVFVRRLLRQPGLAPHVTLLDPSAAMLARAADLPAERVLGRIEALPFGDAAFDVVTCAWALETATAPLRAIAELRRVTRPGGLICIAFCADRRDISPVARLMRWAVEARGTGRFLSVPRIASALESGNKTAVLPVPCRGPAAVLLARPA